MREKIKLSKSQKKFIRKEKARIRREILNLEEQQRLIDQLYKRFLKGEKKKGGEEIKDKKDERVKESANQTESIVQTSRKKSKKEALSKA